MDIQNTVPYAGILFRHENEWSTLHAITWMNVENMLSERSQL